MSFEMACEFVAETDSAVLIRDPASDEEIWIPLSQVDKIVRDSKGAKTGTITMSDWIASKKGLS